jgi:hypothetical protein
MHRNASSPPTLTTSASACSRLLGSELLNLCRTSEGTPPPFGCNDSLFRKNDVDRFRRSFCL